MWLARFAAAMMADLAGKHWAMLSDNIFKGDLTTYNPPKLPLRRSAGRRHSRSASAGPFRTGSYCATAKLRTTRQWCQLRGMQARATTKEIPGRTRLHCSAIPWPILRSRSSCCALCTRSIRVWPVPAIPSTLTGMRSPRSKSSRPARNQARHERNRDRRDRQCSSRRRWTGARMSSNN